MQIEAEEDPSIAAQNVPELLDLSPEAKLTKPGTSILDLAIP